MIQKNFMLKDFYSDDCNSIRVGFSVQQAKLLSY